jgi:hypothetical protein
LDTLSDDVTLHLLGWLRDAGLRSRQRTQDGAEELLLRGARLGHRKRRIAVLFVPTPAGAGEPQNSPLAFMCSRGVLGLRIAILLNKTARVLFIHTSGLTYVQHWFSFSLWVAGLPSFSN